MTKQFLPQSPRPADKQQSSSENARQKKETIPSQIKGHSILHSITRREKTEKKQMMNGLNIEILKCKAFNGDQQKQQKLEEGERWSKRTTSNKNSAETREENERKSMRRE